jgi:hypothetical protein
MNFCSDNATGVSPEIMAAIAAANCGAVMSYRSTPAATMPVHRVGGSGRPVATSQPREPSRLGANPGPYRIGEDQ